MIKEETIKSFIFLEQTTYYIYKSKEDREKGIYSISFYGKLFPISTLSTSSTV